MSLKLLFWNGDLSHLRTKQDTVVLNLQDQEVFKKVDYQATQKVMKNGSVCPIEMSNINIK